MNTRKVNITLEHIRAGRQNNSACCPLALAIMADKPTPKFVAVMANIVCIDGAEYNHTEETSRFINDFDNDKTVTPGEYELIFRDAIRFSFEIKDTNPNVSTSS